MVTNKVSIDKTLLLVDGSSYLYRAFHALPDLRSPQGEPTGAIKGVLSMLTELRADFPSDYSACVFDAKGKTFRDDWYPEYKANRAADAGRPARAGRAIARGHCRLWLECADDRRRRGGRRDRHAGAAGGQDGVRCVISTGDKDLTQLVNEHVLWVNTMSEERLGEAGVKAKFGVEPARIVDYLALVGDTVDNVPGVPKCGPKTAVKWLTQYGTLDNLIAHAGEIERRGRREPAQCARLAAAGAQAGHGQMRCGAAQALRRTGRTAAGHKERLHTVRNIRLQELAARPG